MQGTTIFGGVGAEKKVIFPHTLEKKFRGKMTSKLGEKAGKKINSSEIVNKIGT